MLSVHKILYALFGLVCTALGVIGVWLPGLPTTPFLLVALWAFSHSSDQLHQWLLKIPILRPALQEAHRFQRERTLDIRIKIIAQACAWASLVVVSFSVQSLALSIVVGVLAVSCSLFTYITPTKPKRLTTVSDSADPA